MLPRRFTVLDVQAETHDTVTLGLAPVDGIPMAFRPGQFAMVGRPGFGEVPISISGDPDEPARLMHTVRAVGDATAALTRCAVGDPVFARGPYGRGWEEESGTDGDVLVVAGGIGLAPVRPVVLAVLRHRERYGRVVVVVGSRTPTDLLYRPQLEEWAARDDLDVVVTVDAGEPSWRGNVGLVTDVLPDLDPAATLVLVCGPEVMMRLTADALVRRGVVPSQIRVSMERNMRCGVGLCGHCQLREVFVCVDGPVLGYDRARTLMTMRGL